MPQKSLVKWFESWGCNPPNFLPSSVYIAVLTSYPICQTLLKPFPSPTLKEVTGKVGI